MEHFHPIRLELLRTGPQHNQLLSPLTPYLALCGNSWPITFQIRHEHHRFLSRLERLRYVVPQGRSGAQAVPDRLREAAVSELGHDVAAILAEIPSLLAELSNARGVAQAHDGMDRAAGTPRDLHLAHLSLMLGGSELALIPFELAFSPQAWPGEGQEFCLQLRLPVVPTRQTRRKLMDTSDWDPLQRPKVLVIAAAPAGTSVPLAEHLHALRAAVEPWVGWPKETVAPGDAPEQQQARERARLPLVKQQLRVLHQATLAQIEAACASERYSHVHVLAHGGSYEIGGERQYGLVLHDRQDAAKAEIVSGRRLAKALRTLLNDGSGRSSPLMVTLATCDSGNAGSVLVPGGSIAHDLHDEGIPWVLASQFPLTKAGSVQMTEQLYPGLLRGDDPRQVLHELRRRLYMNSANSHDWASIVAYASLPQDFEAELARHFEKQSLRAIEAGFQRADQLLGLITATQGATDAATASAELDGQLQGIRQLLQLWLNRLPDSGDDAARSRRAECYGMHGSASKRIALLKIDQSARPDELEAARALLREAMGHYRKAMTEYASGSRYYWVATQMLSLAAVLQETPDADTFHVVQHFTRRNLHGSSREDKAWAHGTLAELTLLALHHAPEKRSKPDQLKTLAARVREHCEDIVELSGWPSFQVESTRRQFERYLRQYARCRPAGSDPVGQLWTQLAEVAVQALTRPATAATATQATSSPTPTP